jgi:short-subunit dehydrogenase
MKNLRKLRVLITGASAGIGEATALALAIYNPQLLLVSRNQEKLSEVAFRIKAQYPNCPTPIVIACDLTKDDQVKKMIDTSNAICGGIDVLINNAGYGVYGA